MYLKRRSHLQKSTKHYTEIRLIVPRAVEEQIANFLIDLGSNGIWFKPVNGKISLIGYLPGYSDLQTTRMAIIHYLKELTELGFQTGKIKVDLQRIEAKDWSKEWKKSFKPIFVTAHVVILPEWDKSEFPDKIVIRISPGMAFGTGDHATTQLCMKALNTVIKSGHRIVDMGCGSGILSILSVKLGASYALGLDIDRDAINNAEENLALNNVKDVIEVRQGTANAGIPPESFDVSVSNINRIEIVESYDKIEPLVRFGGTLIFSGILDGEEGYMADFFKRQKLKNIQVTHQEEWVCFVGRK